MEAFPHSVPVLPLPLQELTKKGAAGTSGSGEDQVSLLAPSVNCRHPHTLPCVSEHERWSTQPSTFAAINALSD